MLKILVLLYQTDNKGTIERVPRKIYFVYITRVLHTFSWNKIQIHNIEEYQPCLAAKIFCFPHLDFALND